MDRTETSQLDSALNVTELSDLDFQMLVDIYELADRASRDQSRTRVVGNCKAIKAKVFSFFVEQGLHVDYDEIQDTYHYSTEDGGN